ncbi:hypothetical protein DFA_09692 [Cavenderia fasciculata]|uniref:Pesticidal crystal protein N-terminal domain-containing protein n=1 Tax=Cavenderia fasciculata TaxID=261658 RepID=F4Q8C0_CACFS|nr:uncharacterized protein DFA_09692 [Cavenderia fasciculata]EGG16020.1 hypothetical protein DFA_09692 [Cavenderia fasciculata]|eukprot:XP_004352345.1 hypothetical protein DFA_09692 [Cavenderia fasciculata]
MISKKHHQHNHSRQRDHIPLNKQVTQEEIQEAKEKYLKDGKRVIIGDLTDAQREAIHQRIESVEKMQQKDDPFDLLTSTDWGNIIGLVLSFTPYVGSFLKVGFGIVWGKIFSKNGQYITQDQFQKEMASLYQKIETMLNEKLDDSEMNRCMAMFIDCQNRGNNFNDLLTLFIDRQQAKAGFIPNKNLDYRVEPPAHLTQLDDDTLLQMIRTQFMSYRDFLEGALINFSQPLYAHILGSLYGMTMLIYSNFMRDACFQAITWGFPPAYVYGNNGDVKSLVQTLHDKTQDFHYYLARCNLYYELQLIKPATWISPSINLPDNAYKLFSQINNLDLMEYPANTPLMCIDNPDANGNFQCYDPTGVCKIFKIDPSKSSTGVQTDPHYDTVSGYIPVYPLNGYGLKYTVQRSGSFFYYMTVTFAIYDYVLGSEYDLYINGKKIITLNTIPSDDGCLRGPRMSYYYERWLVANNQQQASTYITVKLDFQNALYSSDIQLFGFAGYINAVEVSFPNKSGKDFIKVDVPKLEDNLSHPKKPVQKY